MPTIEFSSNVDLESQFQVVDALLSTAEKQVLLLMDERDISVPAHARMGFSFVASQQGRAGSGFLSVTEICHRLRDAELLEVDDSQRVALTPRGHCFAKWLSTRQERADYFSCSEGEWGTEMIDPLGLAKLLKNA